MIREQTWESVVCYWFETLLVSNCSSVTNHNLSLFRTEIRFYQCNQYPFDLFSHCFFDCSVGSFTGVVVSQLLPALLHFKVIGTRNGLWRAVEDWIILVLFFGVMIICTYSAVASMIRNFWFVSCINHVFSSWKGLWFALFWDCEFHSIFFFTIECRLVIIGKKC